MARKKGAETLVEFRRGIFSNYFFSLAIIMLSLLMLSLSYCARGGGTPIPILEPQQEAGVIDSATIPAVETGPPPEQPICGNGKLEIEINEQCDLGDLGGATCASLSAGQEEGDLSCTQDCTFNTIMCYAVIPQAGSGSEDPASYGGS
jgi:hypothetical protein